MPIVRLSVSELQDYAVNLLPEDGSEVLYADVAERAISEGQKDALVQLRAMRHSGRVVFRVSMDENGNLIHTVKRGE